MSRKKKKGDIVICGVIALVGLVLFVCNIFKIAPGLGNSIESAITIVIAYGFLTGPVLMMIGVGGLLETINTPTRNRKKRL